MKIIRATYQTSSQVYFEDTDLSLDSVEAYAESKKNAISELIAKIKKTEFDEKKVKIEILQCPDVDWEHERNMEIEADHADENPPAEDNDPIQD